MLTSSPSTISARTTIPVICQPVRSLINFSRNTVASVCRRPRAIMARRAAPLIQQKLNFNDCLVDCLCRRAAEAEVSVLTAEEGGLATHEAQLLRQCTQHRGKAQHLGGIHLVGRKLGCGDGFSFR